MFLARVRTQTAHSRGQYTNDEGLTMPIYMYSTCIVSELLGSQ